jgi:hypothetical protein
MKWAYVSCWRDMSGFYRIEKHLHEENNLLRAGVRIEEIRYLTFFGNRRFGEHLRSFEEATRACEEHSSANPT